MVGAATALALAAYVGIGYATGFKGKAYNVWCPNRRRNSNKISSMFYGQVDQASEQPEVDARTWMVRYVRLSLKGKGGDPPRRVKDRQSSLRCGGTGRYSAG